MKILIVSDQVDPIIYSSGIEKFKYVDMILSCGDLPRYYLDFIISSINKPLFYVRGNHFRPVEYTSYGAAITEIAGGINLDERVIAYKQMVLMGFEGSHKYNNEGVQYTDTEMFFKVARTLPKLWLKKIRYPAGPDIIVTHCPPLGINDRTDSSHVGFKIFRRLIHKYQPRFFLHGHSHYIGANEKRETRVGRTRVINTTGHIVIDTEVNNHEP